MQDNTPTAIGRIYLGGNPSQGFANICAVVGEVDGEPIHQHLRVNAAQLKELARDMNDALRHLSEQANKEFARHLDALCDEYLAAHPSKIAEVGAILDQIELPTVNMAAMPEDKPLIKIGHKTFTTSWDKVAWGKIYHFSTGTQFRIQFASGYTTSIEGEAEIAETVAIWEAASRTVETESFGQPVPAASTATIPDSIAQWLPAAQQLNGINRIPRR